MLFVKELARWPRIQGNLDLRGWCIGRVRIGDGAELREAHFAALDPLLKTTRMLERVA